MLETAWRVNRDRPAGQSPLRVVGVFPRLDLPSLAVAKAGPWYERLRVIRVLRDPISLVYHDALYAHEVERETLDRHERGIVWVGDAHASLRHREPIVMGSKLSGETPRMGCLLYSRHGDRVAEITMHYAYDNHAIAPLLEQAVSRGKRPSVGFDVEPSPVAPLRDVDMRNFRFQPATCMADLCEGYILLKPAAQMTRCRWMSGYVSTQMFTRDRPFFDIMLDGRAKSAEDVNRLASEEQLRF